MFALDAQSGGDGHGSLSANMTVRVPASRFETVMNQLASIGTVRSRSVRAEDLSSSITDSSARLRNLKRTEDVASMQGRVV